MQLLITPLLQQLAHDLRALDAFGAAIAVDHSSFGCIDFKTNFSGFLSHDSARHDFNDGLHQGGVHQAVGDASDKHDGASGQGWREGCHLSHRIFFTPVVDDQQINQAANDLSASQPGHVHLEQQAVVKLKQRATFGGQDGIHKINERLVVVANIVWGFGQAEMSLEVVDGEGGHSGHLCGGDGSLQFGPNQMPVRRAEFLSCDSLVAFTLNDDTQLSARNATTLLRSQLRKVNWPNA